MSFITFRNIQDHVMETAGLGERRRSLCIDWVDRAAEDVEDAADWQEMMGVAHFNTVAPYDTGTVASSGTTITGTGTTFAAAMAGRKFAAGFGQPFFKIDTFTDTTTIDLVDSWPFTALSGDTYTIYQDVYSLDSTCKTLKTKLVTLHDADGGMLGELPQGGFTARHHVPHQSGCPQYFTLIEDDSSGNTQIQVGPYAPDAVYRIRYYFKKRHVPLSADGDIPAVGVPLREVIAAGALIRAYELPEFRGTGMAQEQEARYQRMLSAKVAAYRRSGPNVIRPAAFGRPARAVNPINFPVSAD